MVRNIKCVVNNCQSKRDVNVDRHFNSFSDKKNEIYDIWMNLCGVIEIKVKKAYVCDLHFNFDGRKLKRLQKGMLPSKNLPENLTMAENNDKTNKEFKSYKRCIMKNCENRNLGNSCKNFQFPKKNTARYEQWLNICMLPENVEKKKISIFVAYILFQMI